MPMLTGARIYIVNCVSFCSFDTAGGKHCGLNFTKFINEIVYYDPSHILPC